MGKRKCVGRGSVRISPLCKANYKMYQAFVFVVLSLTRGVEKTLAKGKEMFSLDAEIAYKLKYY